MGMNSQEVAYGFGQMGSIFSTAGSVKPPKGMVIIAVQALGTTTFTALTDSRDGNIECVAISSSDHAHSSVVDGTPTPTDDRGSGGVSLTGTISEGHTLYGRWSQATASSGSFIAYLGE